MFRKDIVDEATDWSRGKGVFMSGINLKHSDTILHRRRLVDRVKQMYDCGERHFLFYAPPATGKTALAQLLMSSLTHVHAVYIPCADYENDDPFHKFLPKKEST
jgi:DNA polymerase III delta prime subunit